MDIYTLPNGDQNHLVFYAYVGPFDQGAAAVKAQGIDVLSAKHLALSRRLAGKQHPVSRNWSWVAENFVYDNGRDADVLVVAPERAPILQNAVAATAAHLSEKEFSAFNYATLRERADADPAKAIQSGVLLLPRASIKGEIPTTAFGDDPLTQFLFREEATPYGQFLQPEITSVPVYVVSAAYAKKRGAQFARALGVDSLVSGSDLVGDGRGLHLQSGRVSGVRFVDGPAKQVSKIEGFSDLPSLRSASGASASRKGLEARVG